MVIWPEFRIGYRDDDHREDAPTLRSMKRNSFYCHVGDKINDVCSFFNTNQSRGTANYCSTAKSTLHTCLLHISMVTIPTL